MTNQIPTTAFVEVRALEDGAYRVVARVRLADGKVSVEGDPAFVEDLNDGLEHPLTRGRVTPADGFQFLSLVSNTFQNPYLLATPVTEEA